MYDPLTLARLLVVGGVLSYATYEDLKERAVSDLVWIVGGGFGISVIIFECLSTRFDLIELVSIGLVGAISYALYKADLYGGADALAIITVSVILPIFRPSHAFHSMAGLMVLTNSLILSLSIPIYFAIRNLLSLLKGERIFEGFEEPLWKKLFASFIGYRSKKPGKFFLTLEKVEGGKRRLDLSLKSTREDFVQGEDIWVTPAIPMILFMLAGFVVMVLYGDLLFSILMALRRL